MELAGKGFLEKVAIPQQSFRGSTYSNKRKEIALSADSGVLLCILLFGTCLNVVQASVTVAKAFLRPACK